MDLVKVELEHNKIKSYMKKSGIICGITLLIMLFIFCDEEIYKNSAELIENWPSMIYIESLVLLFSFSILAAVMYSKFIVTEYSGKRAILLFSYPIKRSKIVNVKCGIITVFTILSIILSSALIYGIFFGVAKGYNPNEQIINNDQIIYLLQMFSIVIIFSYTIAIISGYLGLSGDSVQTTIVAAIIMCIISTQVISSIYSGDGVATEYTGTVVMVDAMMVVVSLFAHRMIVNKVKNMELE